jgi:aryl sulfotransferase
VSDSALWDRFELRPGDIVISPPAKCGTTWLQMLCGLLIFDTIELPRPLTEISPWLDAVTYDVDATIAALEAQQHRRFVKTHTPLDGLPFHEEVTYLCAGRDPRDVALSFDHAMANVDPEVMQVANDAAGLGPEDLPRPPDDPLERFRLWADGELVDDPAQLGATLANLVHHAQTFWDRRDEPQVVLFHYDDLLADLPGQVRRLADELAIEIGDERIEELAAAATFDAMRSRADDLAPGVDAQLWIDNRAFFHSGTSGQWRDLLDPPTLRHYEDRLAKLASPDLARWLHTGWGGDALRDRLSPAVG